MNSNSPIDLSFDGFGIPSTNTSTAQPAAAAASEPQAAAKPKAPRRKPTPSQQPEKPHKGGESTRLNPIVAFFRKPETRHTLGVLLVVISVVMLIVMFNYLKSGAADQSIVEGRTITEIADSGEKINNTGGAFGAWLAHVLLVEGLGLGSLVTVVYTAVLGLSLFGLVRCRFWSFTFKCLFTAISVSIILGLLTYHAGTEIYWGGDHGRYVNEWLYHVSDVLGQFAVTVTLAGLLTVMYFAQLRSFIRNVSGSVSRARDAMAHAAAEARKGDTTIADVPGSEPEASAEPAKEPATATPASVTEIHSAFDRVVTPAPAADSSGLVGFSIDDEEPAATDDPVPAETHPAAEPAKTEFKPATPGEPEFSVSTGKSDEDFVPEAGEEPRQEPLDIRDELSRYRFPGVDLLIDRPVKEQVDEQEQEDNKNMIVKALGDYGIGISKIEATVGPTITLYEIVPAEGVRISQIKRIEDDIARALAALGVRIIAPIPGKYTVGIEVPNRVPQTVSMYTVINSAKFRSCKMELPMALGKTIDNDIFIADLAKMPHMLVAGATGQGKSVGLNCIIASLLYKKHPGELKFVLIDPKMVEFSLYSRLEKHYLAKLPEEEDAIVTDPAKALSTLQSLCIEMDARYELLKSASVRNIDEYNRKFTNRRLNPEKGHRYMPYIVVIVDEFADLIMTAGKDITVHIARIAQKARAVGIHMIIATQRPSTDIITGMIKANFPCRIAFKVAQMVDSRTILDQPGANRLIGRGDMLFSLNSSIQRVQCAFIDTPEVEAIVDFIDNQIGYPTAYLLPEPQNDNAAVPGAVDLSKRDELFDDCARFIVSQGTTASTSMLQRRFGIGYNKAGKIVDQLEAAGIVGAANGQKPRAVLIDQIALEDLLRTL